MGIRRARRAAGRRVARKRLVYVSLTAAICVLPLFSPVSSTTIRVPGEIATIQAALDSAAVGDTVLVAAGIYTGAANRNLTFSGKDLVLVSEEGPEATVINCQVGGRGVLFESGESPAAVLEGFTITYGVAVGTDGDGGANILIRDASPTVRDCSITLGLVSTGGLGGGILCDGGAPLISDCFLELNDVFEGSGGGVACVGSDAVIEGCVITTCRADIGGGVFLSGGFATLRDCEIASNEARFMGGDLHQGGGIHATGGRIEGSRIAGNRVRGGDGGGFYGSAQILNSVITGNLAESPPEGEARGGGLFAGVETLLSESTVAGNLADSGGGIYGEEIFVERSIVWGHGPCGGDVVSAGGLILSCSCYETLAGDVIFLDEQVTEDPGFCDPRSCSAPPSATGDHTLRAGSPCLPENSPCGLLIGALPLGCPASSAPVPGVSAGAVFGRPFPNPSPGRVRWAVHASRETAVRARLYDASGRLVARLFDGVLPAGEHVLTRDVHAGPGSPVTGGVYFLRLEAGRHRETRRVVISK